jgi:hypothetical protein
MVAQKSQGLSGLNAAIKKQRIKTNVANIFKSFCLANYLNDSRIDGGAYGYNKYLAKLRLRPGQYVRGNPARGKSNVKCWSSRAVEIRNKAFFGNKIRVSFAGQQLKADRYTNKFDVAFVSYCSKNKALPSVDWLAVRKYVATREIDVPRNHDKMFLLVVHRGPEVMKVEQAFAKGAGPAAFKFSVSMGSNPQIRLSRNTTETDSIMSLSMLQSSLDKIAAADFLEDVSTEILARKDQTDEVIPANAVKYELELEKLLELETNTISNLRISVKDGNYDLIEGFIAFYNSVNEEEKSRLDSLKTRLKDILKFEQLQGNDEPGVYLKELDD